MQYFLSRMDLCHQCVWYYGFLDVQKVWYHQLYHLLWSHCAIKHCTQHNPGGGARSSHGHGCGAIYGWKRCWYCSDLLSKQIRNQNLGSGASNRLLPCWDARGGTQFSDARAQGWFHLGCGMHFPSWCRPWLGKCVRFILVTHKTWSISHKRLGGLDVLLVVWHLLGSLLGRAFINITSLMIYLVPRLSDKQVDQQAICYQKPLGDFFDGTSMLCGMHGRVTDICDYCRRVSHTSDDIPCEWTSTWQWFLLMLEQQYQVQCCPLHSLALPMHLPPPPHSLDVMKLSHKRRGEGCWSCVGQELAILTFLLTFCLHAPAFYSLKKAHGMTFVPFYSAEIGNLSKNRTKVAQPQCEMQILIENGNQVVWPPCQTFHSWIFIQKGNTVVWPPSQILWVWHIIKKGRQWQNSLFQWEFLLYFNRTMGNSCKIMNKIKINLHLHHNIN